MAKHEVVIHENTGALKETAPYLGSYIVKETKKLGSFVSEIAKQCGLPAIQVEAILTGSFEIFEELEQQSLVRIHTDVGTICGVITGSFPTSDAAFDKERNALELVLRLDDEIKLALTDVVPFIAQDDSLTKLRVDNVMDLETPKPYNLIHGQGVFRVAGFNMVLDDEGASAYLVNALGTTFPLVVDEVVSKQLFKAHTAALLEAGDYKLVVKSRAGDAEGPLQASFRKVKYLRVVAPTVRIDKVIDQEGNEDNIACYNGEVHVKGENLMLLPGDTVKVRGTHYETREEIEHVFEDSVYNAETGEIDITVGDADTEDLALHFDTDAAELVVTSRGGVSGSAPQVTTRSITLKGA